MSETALLFLHALTGLHPGSGSALGIVDLPVQRERHTLWPTIPGSSLKGVLRDASRQKVRAQYDNDLCRADEEDPAINVLFGSAQVEADSAHAGAVSVTDARILAFPVRSLCGVFAWVTCPAVLNRLDRELKLFGYPALGDIPDPGTEKIACSGQSPLLLAESNQVVLEEFEFTRIGDAGPVAGWIAEQATIDPGTKDRMADHLVVLSDDDFTHFARHATEITARIALDYYTKTAKEKHLFYEEYLPAETLFYSLVIASESRNGQRKSAPEVLDLVTKFLPPVIQIGGDATVGKGLCAVRLFRTGEVRS